MESKAVSGAQCVGLYEAKTHLSSLVEKAAQGESVVIAKAGRPVARLVAVDVPPEPKRRRLGCLAGAFEVPDAETFNALGRDEIERLFGGDA